MSESVMQVLDRLMAKDAEKKPAGQLRTVDSKGLIDDTVLKLLKGQTYPKGREWLSKLEKELEEPTRIIRITKLHPLDGAHALALAIETLYGFAKTESSMGMFGPNPPSMIDVQTGIGTSKRVPWGELSTPDLGDQGRIATTVAYDDNGRPVFQVVVTCRKKHQESVDTLLALMEKIGHEQSIYRGKALKIDTRSLGPKERDGNPTALAPKFLDLSRVNPDELTFDELTMNTIEYHLFAKLKHTQHFRNSGMNLKDGVLLHGVYGTGKSMTADCTAKLAVMNGWTYMYIDDARKIKEAYYEALAYAPTLLFVEDVDKVVGGARDSDMDQLLNVMDGTESKGREVIVVGTTNEPLKVHKAFLRAGRLGTTIELKPPTVEVASRLIRLYGGKDLRDGINLTVVGKMLEGVIPADIRKAVETARIVAFGRNPTASKVEVSERDIEIAAAGLEAAKAFFKSHETPPTVLEEIGRASVNRLGELVASNGNTK